MLKYSKQLNIIIDEIDLLSILETIHEFLTSIGSIRSSNDDLGIKVSKTIITEIVKLKKDSIWEYYEVVEKH